MEDTPVGVNFLGFDQSSRVGPFSVGICGLRASVLCEQL